MMTQTHSIRFKTFFLKVSTVLFIGALLSRKGLSEVHDHYSLQNSLFHPLVWHWFEKVVKRFLARDLLAY